MNYYPIMVDLRNRLCTVIGGGAVAERKVEALLNGGASVRVISPELSPQLRFWAAQGRIAVLDRPYQDGDLADTFLAISATDNILVNEQAATEAKRRGIMLNVTDNPQLGDFIVPAVVEQGPLVIAVSTGGCSPALAKKIRQELAGKFGPEYGLFLTMLGNLREQVTNSLAAQAERQEFWEDLVKSDILALLAEGRIEEAEEKIQRAVNRIGT